MTQDRFLEIREAVLFSPKIFTTEGLLTGRGEQWEKTVKEIPAMLSDAFEEIVRLRVLVESAYIEGRMDGIICSDGSDLSNSHDWYSSVCRNQIESPKQTQHKE